jgi:hypothetical protein
MQFYEYEIPVSLVHLLQEHNFLYKVPSIRIVLHMEQIEMSGRQQI